MREFDVRPLAQEELGEVDSQLPLHRLDQHHEGNSTYLVAWDARTPVGHAFIAWPGRHLKEPSLPELQDMYVTPDRRREGIGAALTEAAEREAAARGFERLMLSVSVDNEPARRLYERAGYVEAGLPLERVSGTIVIRGRPVEVDDTLVYLVKNVPIGQE